MLWRLASAALSFIACTTSLAQEPKLAFEVATIKPTDPNASHIMGVRIYPGARVRIPAVSLKSLIVTAFGLSYWQIAGGEGWIDNEQYDVEAKPPADLQPEIRDSALFLVRDRRWQAA